MVAPFSIDTYLPSFPSIETEFGVGRALLSQSLAVYLAAFAVSTIFWGPVADRFGRRLVILLSVSFYALASIGCALSGNIHELLMMRVFQGLAASGGFIASRAMIRDVHDAKSAHKAMSLLTLLFVIAPAIAPILGGWLQGAYGWRSVFWFLTGFAFLLVLLSVRLTETLHQDARRSIHPVAVFKVYVSTFKHIQYLCLVFALSFSFAGMFLYIAGAPSVIFGFLGLGFQDFSVLFVPMVAGMMLGSYLSSQLAHRLPVHQTISLGFLLMLLAVVGNLVSVHIFVASPVSVLAPLVVYAFGAAIVMPAIIILILDCFPGHRGSAAAMQGFLQMSVNALVASVAVPLLEGQWLYFVCGQSVFLGIGLILWLVVRRKGWVNRRQIAAV
jgi:MFS transporter, DHA1 family, multidrug resistance protein